MKTVVIYGITGKKGAGKSTFARQLGNAPNVKRFDMALADAIKMIGTNVFSLTDEQLRGDKKEVIDECWGVSPREIMQFVGTRLFREHIHELIPQEKLIGNIWTTVLLKRIEKLVSDPYSGTHFSIVVDDIRFPDEEQAIRKYCEEHEGYRFVMTKIVRPDLEYAPGVATETAKHPSETQIDLIKVDHTVVNDKGIFDFTMKGQWIR